LHISFIHYDTFLSFIWTEREGGITRGKEKERESGAKRE
jgi:hypothetical protein